MHKTSLFKQILVLFFVIFVLNIIADIFYLHWTIWWYDVFLHFLAGICVGLVFVMLNIYNNKSSYSHKNLVLGILSVLFVGVVWEIFELKIGQTFLADGVHYYRDTFSDIMADLSGGFVSMVYVSKSKK